MLSRSFTAPRAGNRHIGGLPFCYERKKHTLMISNGSCADYAFY
jgi:hypothetical protein